ncbi:ABC transporter ATP-binding protein [Kribbella sp. VKM Ac-2568]|uniref:ABC transporter ATP-binding protein n=1 Tax=Kribbella sp. VKM Ac-2568 TaxID=2512219 RepID=UPI0010D0F2EB|nr:ABC transporter ATP-binding protein [Kribbella sp. VKM Ac-2568]TCM51227.1 ABC-2 type transport system ATP-binding protein [Kribbella sp. VKM Ac-2568]
MDTQTAQPAPDAAVTATGFAVQVDAVRKSFGAVAALRGVSLEVRPGQVYGVLGPNGAGKTTLLRILLGLVRPDDGSVRVLGRAPGSPQALRRIGALIETPAFVPHLSGRTNLQVLARARGLRDAEVDRVLEVVELQHRGGDRFSGYSLGMGQRLGVAAALLGDPALLILDEPTNGLDPEGVATMRTLIRDLGRSGTTVLLSSHLLGEVQQICDRVVVIDRGLVIADDTVSAIRDRPGTTALDIWATPLETAGQVLADLTVELVGEGEDRHWHLETAPDDVPGLVRALVAAGVDVHEIRRERQTLEGVFFALTAHQDEQEES